MKDQDVYAVVAAIPEGHVMTYGQIALLLGAPNLSRRVGRALTHAPARLPCHRVVNSAGRLAPGFLGQREMLENEGIQFGEHGRVNVKQYAWWPEEREDNSCKSHPTKPSL